MAHPSHAFMDPKQKPPNQRVCSMCGRKKLVTIHTTRIGLCPICDTDNLWMTLGLVWPDDFIEWHRGMPYPEPYGE